MNTSLPCSNIVSDFPEVAGVDHQLVVALDIRRYRQRANDIFGPFRIPCAEGLESSGVELRRIPFTLYGVHLVAPETTSGDDWRLCVEECGNGVR